MDKMKYETLREKAYYQLGYCAGYEEMGKEIRGCLMDDDEINLPRFKEWLDEYIEFEEKYSKEILTKLQKKLKIKTLDGSMADENLIYKEKE